MAFIFPNSWDDDPIWRTHIFQGVGVPPIRLYIYSIYTFGVFCCEVMSIVDTSPSSLAKNHGVRVLRPRHGRLRRSETWSMEAAPSAALWLRKPPLALMIRWGMTFKPNISNKLWDSNIGKSNWLGISNHPICYPPIVTNITILQKKLGILIIQDREIPFLTNQNSIEW